MNDTLEFKPLELCKEARQILDMNDKIIDINLELVRVLTMVQIIQETKKDE